MRLKLLLNSVDKVKSFVRITGKFDVWFKVYSGPYIVDGKSIMGLFSLDLSTPVEVELMDGNDVDLELFQDYLAQENLI